MKQQQLLALFVASIAAGCGYPHPASVDGGTGGVDAPPTCGGLVCDHGPSSTCTGNTLQTFPGTCSAESCSYPETDVDCGALGCCTDHCCAFQPSNADVFGVLPSSGNTATWPGGTFDTDTDCTATSGLGACEVASRGQSLGSACVCRVGQLTLGDLTVTGSLALVIFAAKTVSITGTLDIGAHGAVNGPGWSAGYASAAVTAGGAGGSYGATGGIGTGDDVMGTSTDSYGSNAAPAAGYGNALLVPLVGGMSGQAGDNGSGGGGGGALQVSAGVSIEVNGIISAGGGGGESGGVTNHGELGGGGGGAGGSVLLEATTVTIAGTVVANGGAGGDGGVFDGSSVGCGSASDGADAGTSTATSGPPCYGECFGGLSSLEGGPGGAGASGSAAGNGYYGTMADACSTGDLAGGGGGGGSTGRLRINTLAGTPVTGTFSPMPTFGPLTAQ
jgi:hypothetical protein